MSAVRILVISGSLREGSFNQRLADQAAIFAQEAGAEVTSLKLDAVDLPLYTPSIELNAFPEGARRLKLSFAEHDGLLIASPEHNGSIPSALKNAIDWASRPTGGETPLALTAFRGKVAGIMSASPSPFGGLRGLMHLRQILGTVQALVVPEQVAVPFAERAFQGSELTDAMAREVLAIMAQRVVTLAGVVR
ncbi:MAG: NADPH-dependent FMN reductase [Alphaproteobacteria bacterium HGW-Alphaproteobacteria-18]|nr:MAG: NADPH-dependent FMN reductase [Alphaproteobacteria bacterium HGW-Alphaproteobacteria-18]